MTSTWSPSRLTISVYEVNPSDPPVVSFEGGVGDALQLREFLEMARFAIETKLSSLPPRVLDPKVFE